MNKDTFDWLKRKQDEMAFYAAGSLALTVSFPTAWLIVYGVGFWGWNPVLCALAMLAIPTLTLWITYLILQRNK